MVSVSPLQPQDRALWESLWQESVGGVMGADVVEYSFQSIMDGKINAMVAKKGGAIIGLLHYVVHPVAGCLYPVCYMQDLYVSPKHRRGGVARALVGNLKNIADDQGYDRIYWLLDHKNVDAQKFYDGLGVALDFGLYMIPIKMRERLNLPDIKLDKRGSQ